jgi:hypothetical protein
MHADRGGEEINPYIDGFDGRYARLPRLVVNRSGVGLTRRENRIRDLIESRGQRCYLEYPSGIIPTFSSIGDRSSPAEKNTLLTDRDHTMAARQLHFDTIVGKEYNVQAVWVVDQLARSGACIIINAWYRIAGGYRCTVGGCMMTDELIAEGKGGCYSVTTRSGRENPTWAGPFYGDEMQVVEDIRGEANSSFVDGTGPQMVYETGQYVGRSRSVLEAMLSVEGPGDWQDDGNYAFTGRSARQGRNGRNRR